MNLTERERTVLQLAQQGLSDYKIARKINTDPPSVTRSRRNAHKKLLEATIDIEGASRIGLQFSGPDFVAFGLTSAYSYFL
jgi:DNA-binding NarL/FixJ family response regulator